MKNTRPIDDPAGVSIFETRVPQLDRHQAL